MLYHANDPNAVHPDDEWLVMRAEDALRHTWRVVCSAATEEDAKAAAARFIERDRTNILRGFKEPRHHDVRPRFAYTPPRPQLQ